MADLYSPSNILAALNAAEPDLIALIGDDWPQLADRYRQLKAALADEEGQWLASVEIIELFAPYAAARERLNRAILEQDLRGSVALGLADIAAQIGATPAAAAPPEPRMRSISLKSPAQATSIKLGNFSFDFGEVSELAAGVIMTGSDVIGDLGVKHYVLVAAGVLLIARSLLKAMTVELSEREATVFYGLAQAAGPDKTATEAAILQRANAARKEVGLKPLDADDLRNALHRLAEIKSVGRVEGSPDRWQIVEQYHLKP